MHQERKRLTQRDLLRMEDACFEMAKKTHREGGEGFSAFFYDTYKVAKELRQLRVIVRAYAGAYHGLPSTVEDRKTKLVKHIEMAQAFAETNPDYADGPVDGEPEFKP